jgi:hypothetical protein
MRLILKLSILSILVTLINCYPNDEDNIEKGENTRILGQLTDFHRGTPIANAMVLVFGCGCDKKNRRTQDYTDDEGMFDLFFVSDGTSSKYELDLWMNTLDDRAYDNVSAIITPGIVNEIDLEVKMATLLKLQVTIDSNSVGPIQISTSIRSFAPVEISQEDSIQNVELYLAPKSKNSINFLVNDTLKAKSRRYQIHYSTGIEDMAFDSINLMDPILWPLDP